MGSAIPGVGDPPRGVVTQHMHNMCSRLLSATLGYSRLLSATLGYSRLSVHHVAPEEVMRAPSRLDEPRVGLVA